MADSEEKKGFLSNMIDKLDKKIEEKAKNGSCCCCNGGKDAKEGEDENEGGPSCC